MEFLKNFFKLLISAVLVFSCSQVRPQNTKTKDSETQTGQSIQFGIFQNTEDLNIDLDDPKFDALVLIFASDTCSTCAEEARYWQQNLKSNLPSNIQFIHYLLGGFKEDAQNWKQAFQVNWNVIYNDSDDLYRRYCPAIITPCLLIYNKNTQTLTQTYKPLRKIEIETLTGEWK